MTSQEYVATNFDRFISEWTEFLPIPSISTDQNDREDIDSAEALEQVFGKKPFSCKMAVRFPLSPNVLGIESTLMGFGLKSDGPRRCSSHSYS